MSIKNNSLLAPLKPPFWLDNDKMGLSEREERRGKIWMKWLGRKWEKEERTNGEKREITGFYEERVTINYVH